jgi:hypothetical protein
MICLYIESRNQSQLFGPFRQSSDKYNRRGRSECVENKDMHDHGILTLTMPSYDHAAGTNLEFFSKLQCCRESRPRLYMIFLQLHRLYYHLSLIDLMWTTLLLLESVMIKASQIKV